MISGCIRLLGEIIEHDDQKWGDIRFTFHYRIWGRLLMTSVNAN